MTIVQSSSQADDAGAGVFPSTPQIGGLYARFVLGVLTLVYVFCIIDRYILSVLAEEIKADLGVSDAQMGFLYGTAFAVFYALFGIPFGRLADVTRRTRLISIGLAFWSVMTMLSGSARSLGALALCRFGVGVGESSATPAAASVLSDYFPPSVRATVISIYSSGTAIGAGLGLIIGGLILDGWASHFPDPATAPLHLKAWQAAFIAVGFPGLLLSLLVLTLREPKRGQTDGISSIDAPSAWKVLFEELAAVLPPFAVVRMFRSTETRRAGLVNMAAACGLTAAAIGLTAWLGSPLQWAALTFGVYCAFSWSQSLLGRDRPAFHLIFRSRAFVLSAIGFHLITFSAQALAFWTVPFLIRVHGASASQVGVWVGTAAFVAGWTGVTFGGVLADWLQRRVAAPRHIVGMLTVALLIPASLVFLITERLEVAFAMVFVFFFTAPMYVGPASCVFIDLVLPRMRGMATALATCLGTFLGLALGPYVTGRVSDGFVAAGASHAEALRGGLMFAMSPCLVAFVLLWIARSGLEAEMAQKVERARALGEPV